MDNVNYSNSRLIFSEIDSKKILEDIQKEISLEKFQIRDQKIYFKTKFLDFSNDEILLKIERTENQIRISDNNRTILNLLSSGFDPFSTKAKEYLINRIAESCGVEIERYGEVFVLSNNMEEVGELAFWMIHAIQRLTAAVMVEKTYRPPSFKKDIAAYLIENNRVFDEDPTFYIGRKLRARIDFSSKMGEELVISRALSYTNMSEAVTFSEKFAHETDLIRENYKGKIFPVAIIDDSIQTSEKKPVFNEDVISLLKRIEVVPWSEKDSLLEIFPSH